MLADLANGLVAVLGFIFTAIQILVIASVLISWVNADPNNIIVQMIHRTTEPMYRPIRKLTSKIPGPFDWSPIGVLLIIIFLQASLLRYLERLAHTAY